MFRAPGGALPESRAPRPPRFRRAPSAWARRALREGHASWSVTQAWAPGSGSHPLCHFPAACQVALPLCLGFPSCSRGWQHPVASWASEGARAESSPPGVGEPLAGEACAPDRGPGVRRRWPGAFSDTPSFLLPARPWLLGPRSRQPLPPAPAIPLGALLCCRKALHLDRSLERAASSACCRLTAAAGGVAPFKNKNSAERNSPRGQPPAFGQRGQGFGLTCRCLDAVTGKHGAFWSGEVPIQDEGRGPFRPPCQGVPVSCRWVARGCLSQGGDSLGSLFLVAGPEEG